jgi:hypothetical protein
MPQACLEEAECILKSISVFKERQVDPNDVRQYVLPALRAAFKNSQAAEIHDFACSLARMPAEFDPNLRLLSAKGKSCLGDILLSGEFKQGHVSEQVRCLRDCLLPGC